MTNLEENIITAINSGVSNSDVTFKKGGLFLYKNGIHQNFAIIIDNNIIIRVDNNCKGIYKKIIKNSTLLNKKILLGTDLISKFMINKFTYSDAEDMLGSLFQYLDKNLVILFNKNDLSLKDVLYDTVDFLEIKEYYTDIITDDSAFRRIVNQFDINTNWFTGSPTVILPKEIKEEFNQSDWISHMQLKNRISVLDELLS